jgi:hypothetical protein
MLYVDTAHNSNFVHYLFTKYVTIFNLILYTSVNILRVLQFLILSLNSTPV